MRHIELSKKNAIWAADSAHVVAQFATQIKAAEEAYDKKIKAVKRSISNVYSKEKRTGQSYATTKDKLRQSLADLDSERAVAISKFKAGQANELSSARKLLRQTSTSINQRYTVAVDSILALNQTHINTRKAAVAAYGGGLAWSTIVALIVFIASVILERIHYKGSGIEETVDLSQYDISPNAITEAWVALKNRTQFVIRSQIRAFAEKTPPAPLPVTPTELYDPTQLIWTLAFLRCQE